MRSDLILGLTGAVVVVIGLSCDKGMEPGTPSGPQDYKVYFSSETAGSPKLFTFHTATLAIDSADMPWGSLRGVTVSADGRRLYIDDGSAIHVTDAISLSHITDLPYQSWSPVAVSLDNRLIAITGRDLFILRTSDYSVVFSDTSNTFEGVFSADSKNFYCASDSSSVGPRTVFSVDLSRAPYRANHKRIVDGSVVQIVPSRDESLWFLYLRVNSEAFAFEVFDVRIDSVIFIDLQVPGAGRLQLAPDDNRVYYGNPGNGFTGWSPMLGFSVYDCRSNSTTRVIDAEFFSWPWPSDTALRVKSPPTHLAVTPDAKQLIMLCSHGYNGVIYSWDLLENKPVNRWIGFPRQFMNLSIERVPRHGSNIYLDR